MKTRITSFVLSVLGIVLIPLSGIGQHTFSIVAVDTATGQVGSAGASCINNSIIISDLHPGVGAIHTQAAWNSFNQVYASSLMDQGLDPQTIIDSLVFYDALGDATVRQYGVVDFDPSGVPRNAGYTGTSNSTWANHISGYNYSIQGNILAGQQILDSIEAGFLNTNGTLAEKLMAALQGANVPGADTRCLPNNTSSLSSFLRVANPNDSNDNFFLHVDVNNTPPGKEPLVSLQDIFNSLSGNCSVLAATFTQSADTIDLATSSGQVLFTDNSTFASLRSWDMGDNTMIENEQVFFHTYAGAGEYTITLIVRNYTCTDTFTSTVVVINNSNINEGSVLANDLVMVYPNPGSDFIYFMFSESILRTNLWIEISNSLGQVIRVDDIHDNPMRINNQRMPAGIYLYKIGNDEDVIDSGKFVIQ
ncbi:MAG: DUF1028 domain-containing protein [Bacteroidetes bacterium]|nr:DUF1028 domain-containing protein [Bacteroidota bacterium]